MKRHTLPNGLTVTIRVGMLDDMPRCAVCSRVVCSHSDLEFAGIVPGPATKQADAA